jgi:rhamnogalacturonyl hydrolase YesR
MNNDTCEPTGSKRTYNQGVILNAATELYKATGNLSYLKLAGNIADATCSKLHTDRCKRTDQGMRRRL